MARKIDWSPTADQVGHLVIAVHHMANRKAVVFSKEENTKGLPKYKAKMTRSRHGDYSFTIGTLAYDELNFAKEMKKAGSHTAGLTFYTDKQAFRLSSASLMPKHPKARS